MPSLRGYRSQVKLGILKDESSALAMFNQKLLTHPGNISLNRQHVSKLVEHNIYTFKNTFVFYGRYGPPKFQSFDHFTHSHLERIVFSEVLWDPNGHSRLLDAALVLVELNTARSTPRTLMPQVSKRCANFRNMLYLQTMD